MIDDEQPESPAGKFGEVDTMGAEACVRWPGTRGVSPNACGASDCRPRASPEDHAYGLGFDIEEGQISRTRSIHGTKLAEDDLLLSRKKGQILGVLKTTDYVDPPLVLAVRHGRIAGRAAGQANEQPNHEPPNHESPKQARAKETCPKESRAKQGQRTKRRSGPDVNANRRLD